MNQPKFKFGDKVARMDWQNGSFDIHKIQLNHSMTEFLYELSNGVMVAERSIMLAKPPKRFQLGSIVVRGNTLLRVEKALVSNAKWQYECAFVQPDIRRAWYSEDELNTVCEVVKLYKETVKEESC